MILSGDDTVMNKIEILNALTMKDEVSVQAFSADGYLQEFYDFYEINKRDQQLTAFDGTFGDAMREVFGDAVYITIADQTRYLFGEPKCVMIFDDPAAVIGEMEGEEDLAPFYIVFDLMFCVYDGFTLCFISGTNN